MDGFLVCFLVGDTEAAAAVFEAGWAAGQRGPALCSAMLAVHADGGQAGAAVALVQSMRRAGVPFDAVRPSPIASNHNEPCCLILIFKAIQAG
jgi:pentatricopeptide repeat protein